MMLYIMQMVSQECYVLLSYIKFRHKVYKLMFGMKMRYGIFGRSLAWCMYGALQSGQKIKIARL